MAEQTSKTRTNPSSHILIASNNPSDTAVDRKRKALENGYFLNISLKFFNRGTRAWRAPDFFKK